MARACEIPYNTSHLHTTHHTCTLHLTQNTSHFALVTKHITLCTYEKALALSLWGLRIWQWSTRSLPGVYSESTRSLPGIYSLLGRSGSSLPRQTLRLAFSHSVLDSIFGPFLDQNRPQMGTQNGQKSIKNRIGFGSLHLNHFLNLFCSELAQVLTSKCCFLLGFSNEIYICTLQPLHALGSFFRSQK